MMEYRAIIIVKALIVNNRWMIYRAEDRARRAVYYGSGHPALMHMVAFLTQANTIMAEILSVHWRL